MFDAIAPRYDLLNRLLTFGMDVRWRRRCVRELGLPRGAAVLDLACGTGDLCRELHRAGYRAFGFDFSARMLSGAGTRAPLVLADVLALPVRDAVADGVTCGFALRNVMSLEALFGEIHRVVRPGGRVALLEVGVPTGRILRPGHRLYFNHVVPFVGGLLSDREAYRYLPASMAYLPPPGELTERFRATGFIDARITTLSGGIAFVLTGTRG